MADPWAVRLPDPITGERPPHPWRGKTVISLRDGKLVTTPARPAPSWWSKYKEIPALVCWEGDVYVTFVSDEPLWFTTDMRCSCVVYVSP